MSYLIKARVSCQITAYAFFRKGLGAKPPLRVECTSEFKADVLYLNPKQADTAEVYSLESVQVSGGELAPFPKDSHPREIGDTVEFEGVTITKTSDVVYTK